MTFKQQLAKATPAQHKLTYQVFNLNKNEQVLFNFTGQIAQGTSSSDRLGDSVYLEALNIHLRLNTLNAILNPVNLHFALLWSSDELTTNTAIYPLPTTAVSPNMDWTLLPGAIETTSQLWNSKAVTKLADFTVDLHEVLAGTYMSKAVVVKVPLKKEFKYQQQGGQYGKNKNLYFYCYTTDYNTGNASGLQIGGCVLTADLIFKNI